MATVFMKWLETRPRDYERGIWLLTLGRLARMQKQVAEQQVKPGMRVLEIGCGTGVLACLMAELEAQVTAIDANPAMLAEAQQRVVKMGLTESVKIKLMDASMIEEKFKPGSYDLIVASLVFSELPTDSQRCVLEGCASLLATDGRLIVIDEVIPKDDLSRVLFYIIRLPLVIVTWLLTRTTTHALGDFERQLKCCGFMPTKLASSLGGSLVVYSSITAGTEKERSQIQGRLSHSVTWKTILSDLWALFFRIIPPYPKVQPGLYTLGTPDPRSPVLVTCNYDLTVRRLVREIDGKVNIWILVVDSKGINVWCASGGGFLTAAKVITAIKTCGLAEVVEHNHVILPQLCANGVDGWKIRSESGFRVRWGPVRAADIPSYLDNGMKKDGKMRLVEFPVIDRLEMCTAALGFYSILILLPVFIFWREKFWPITLTLLGLSYIYALVHPWLPGRDGLYKSVPLALIALVFLGGYSRLYAPMQDQAIYNWGFALAGLSIFIASEMQGMSPLMRGEQANWGWEVIIGLTLAGLYCLGKYLLGWC